MAGIESVIKQRVFEKVAGYQMPEYAKKLIIDAQFLMIVGITAAGKNTVINKLLETGKYHIVVSYTTRAPRINHGVMERDGDEYHFISWERAEDMLDNDQFIEAKIVHRSNLYGTGTYELQQAYTKGLIPVKHVDIQGAEAIKKVSSTAKAVFLLPGGMDTLLARLKSRYGDIQAHQGEIRRRLQTALQELNRALQERRLFAFVLNTDLETAVAEIDELIDKDWESLDFIDGEEAAIKLRSDIEAYLKQQTPSSG